jgi:hypothetical protein
MTDKEKKLIMEYCGWSLQKVRIAINPSDLRSDYVEAYMHELDGNDILEAVKVMESKGDWEKFCNFISEKEETGGLVDEHGLLSFCFENIPYIFQNFFPLMAEFLKESK